MPQVKRDEIREERITMEAVVDAYNEDERAMGWYYYLDDRLQFPFTKIDFCETKWQPNILIEKVKNIIFIKVLLRQGNRNISFR